MSLSSFTLPNFDWVGLLEALAYLVVGYVIASKVSVVVERALSVKFSKHLSAMTRRVVFYLLFGLFLFSALSQLGFKLTVLLGTAGVFTFALSFASQTAASNLMSGLFLLFERPFKIGDVIALKDIRGTVESIDWLSTQVKTGDNRLVRVPNEVLIKSEITNLSKFNTKRDEIEISIPIAGDMSAIRQAIVDICESNKNILKQPAPKLLATRFLDEQRVVLKIMFWSKSDLAQVRDELITAMISNPAVWGEAIPEIER